MSHVTKTERTACGSTALQLRLSIVAAVAVVIAATAA